MVQLYCLYHSRHRSLACDIEKFLQLLGKFYLHFEIFRYCLESVEIVVYVVFKFLCTPAFGERFPEILILQKAREDMFRGKEFVALLRCDAVRLDQCVCYLLGLI